MSKGADRERLARDYEIKRRLDETVNPPTKSPVRTIGFVVWLSHFFPHVFATVCGVKLTAAVARWNAERALRNEAHRRANIRPLPGLWPHWGLSAIVCLMLCGIMIGAGSFAFSHVENRTLFIFVGGGFGAATGLGLGLAVVTARAFWLLFGGSNAAAPSMPPPPTSATHRRFLPPEPGNPRP